MLRLLSSCRRSVFGPALLAGAMRQCIAQTVFGSRLDTVCVWQPTRRWFFDCWKCWICSRSCKPRRQCPPDDEPATHAYVPITADDVPDAEVRPRLRQYGQAWQGLCALNTNAAAASTTALCATTDDDHGVRPPGYRLHANQGIKGNELLAPLRVTLCLSPRLPQRLHPSWHAKTLCPSHRSSPRPCPRFPHLWQRRPICSQRMQAQCCRPSLS